MSSSTSLATSDSLVPAEQAGRCGNVTLVHRRTVHTEHMIDMEGLILKEAKETSEQTTIDGQPFQTINNHLRSIGSRSVQTSEILSDGKVIKSDTTPGGMKKKEVKKFEKEWKKYWKPRTGPDTLKEYEDNAVPTDEIHVSSTNAVTEGIPITTNVTTGSVKETSQASPTSPSSQNPHTSPKYGEAGASTGAPDETSATKYESVTDSSFSDSSTSTSRSSARPR